MSRFSQGGIVETVQVDSKATSFTAAVDHDLERKSVYSVRSLETPLEFLSSPPTVDVMSGGDEEKETRAKAKRHTMRVMSAFMVCFAAGWGDGGKYFLSFCECLINLRLVTGVVLPYIKLQFGLSYTLSGVLFVAVSSG